MEQVGQMGQAPQMQSHPLSQSMDSVNTASNEEEVSDESLLIKLTNISISTLILIDAFTRPINVKSLLHAKISLTFLFYLSVKELSSSCKFQIRKMQIGSVAFCSLENQLALKLFYVENQRENIFEKLSKWHQKIRESKHKIYRH